MDGDACTIHVVNKIIAENNTGPLFELYSDLSKFKLDETRLSNVGADGEFPIRHGSERLGVDQIVSRHGGEFEQQGYTNDSEGVMSALQCHMRDGNFLGFAGVDYLQTFWSTDDSIKVSICVF
jgi:hypothetical protein